MINVTEGETSVLHDAADRSSFFQRLTSAVSHHWEYCTHLHQKKKLSKRKQEHLTNSSELTLDWTVPCVMYRLASSLWEPLRAVVTVFVWWPADFVCCSRLLEGTELRFLPHTEYKHSATHKHTNVHSCSVFSALQPHACTRFPHAHHLHLPEPFCLSFFILFFLTSFPPPLYPPLLPAVLYN